MTKNFGYQLHASFQQTLFQEDLEIQSATLHQRISSTEVGVFSAIETCNKFLLSSALQKCIRRGLAVQSIAIAVRLHQVDPTYLKRRMPIIAVEDVGIGDAKVCHDVVAVCSSSKWWGVEVNRTIAFLSSSMANAVKSRSACDAFCLTEVHSDRRLLLKCLLLSDAANLIDVACDTNRLQIERLLALRVLSGITFKANGSYQVLSRCNLEALNIIAETLKLPMEVRLLMASDRKLLGMAAMLPVAYEATQNAVVLKGHEFPRAMDIVYGLPLCALDQYTQLGKIALRRLFQSSDELQDFASRHVQRPDPQPLINLAMFQTESSILDRYLSSRQLDDLKDATDEAEMLFMGMVEPTNQTQLYRLLKEDADRLADFRIEILNNGFSVRDGDTNGPLGQLTLKRTDS
jgi:hypothetical protein